MADPATGREVLVEFQQIGNAVKVTAMDTKSMVEVSIMGPATAGEEILKRNVINKLNYVLSKKRLTKIPVEKLIGILWNTSCSNLLTASPWGLSMG